MSNGWLLLDRQALFVASLTYYSPKCIAPSHLCEGWLKVSSRRQKLRGLLPRMVDLEVRREPRMMDGLKVEWKESRMMECGVLLLWSEGAS